MKSIFIHLYYLSNFVAAAAIVAEMKVQIYTSNLISFGNQEKRFIVADFVSKQKEQGTRLLCLFP